MTLHSRRNGELHREDGETGFRRTWNGLFGKWNEVFGIWNKRPSGELRAVRGPLLSHLY